MNKVYKVIWNATLNVWVTVSELSKSGKKTKSKLTAVSALIVLSSHVLIPQASAGYVAAGGIAPNTETIAIGEGATTQSTGSQSIAIGSLSKAQSDQSIAVGANTIASGNSSIAIGGDDIDKVIATDGEKFTTLTGTILKGGKGNYTSTTSSGSASVALGMQNVSSGTFSTAIGVRSTSSGLASVALGASAQASNEGALAIGAISNAKGSGAISVGMNTTASGVNSTAIGSGNKAGEGANASAALSTAIGNNAIANKETAVALGSNSKTDADAIDINEGIVNNIIFNNYAGNISNVGSQVSVGSIGFERQIKNVAAGAVTATSTDAINGSQLYSTQNILTNSIFSASSILGGGLTVDQNGQIKGPFIVDGQEYTSVADAISSMTSNMNDMLDVVNTSAKIPQAITAETTAGKNTVVTPITNENGETTGYTVATANDVEFDSVKAGNITTDQASIAKVTIDQNGINAGGDKVTNVANGTIAKDSKDAINGSQLNAAQDSIKTLVGGNATNVNGTVSVSNLGGTGKDNINDAIAAAKTEVNAGKNITVSSTTGANGQAVYTVETAKNVEFDSVKAGNITTDKATIGNITLDSTSNKITGLENGTIAKDSKDAINGSQLNAAQDSIKTLVGGNATSANGTVSVSNLGGTGKDNINDAIAAAKTEVNAGKNITVSSTTGANGQAVYTVETAKNVEFDSVKAGSISTDQASIAKVTIDQNGINAGGDKVTNVANGAVNASSTDAVNGSQLHASNSQIFNYLGGGADYEAGIAPTYNVGGGTQNNVSDALAALDQSNNSLDTKIDNLGNQLQNSLNHTNRRIDDLEKRAMAGVAAAMALETAPYIAGKWTYSAATAYHGGENAVGVTLRKTSDNGRWSITSGIAAASQGSPSIRVGVSGVIN